MTRAHARLGHYEIRDACTPTVAAVGRAPSISRRSATERLNLLRLGSAGLWVQANFALSVSLLAIAGFPYLETPLRLGKLSCSVMLCRSMAR